MRNRKQRNDHSYLSVSEFRLFISSSLPPHSPPQPLAAGSPEPAGAVHAAGASSARPAPGGPEPAFAPPLAAPAPPAYVPVPPAGPAASAAPPPWPAVSSPAALAAHVASASDLCGGSFSPPRAAWWLFESLWRRWRLLDMRVLDLSVINISECESPLTCSPLLSLFGVWGTHLISLGEGFKTKHAPLPIPVWQHLFNDKVFN